MEHDRDENKKTCWGKIIRDEDDTTSQFLNDFDEGLEDLDRRDGSGEGMEGEDDGSDVGTLIITKSGEVY